METIRSRASKSVYSINFDVVSWCNSAKLGDLKLYYQLQSDDIKK